jgi:hypothetical protein
LKNTRNIPDSGISRIKRLYLTYPYKNRFIIYIKNKKTRYKNLKSALSGTRAAQCWMRTIAEQGTSTYGTRLLFFFSVPEPDPDQCVFGPPASGSLIYLQGSGSKKLKKNLTFSVGNKPKEYLSFKQ